MNEKWKAAAIAVYLTICVLDFIVIPAFFMATNTDEALARHWSEIVTTFADHPDVIADLTSRRVADWMPFTLRGAGLFHVAFGAIITGSVLGRNGK